jgi:homocitrate synthase NifV
MKRKIKIVDTTLRDGEQCPGMVFAPSEKVQLALLLDEMGVYEIEAGIFDVGTEGAGYLGEIIKRRKHAKVSLWSRLNPQDVEQAARQKPDLLHIGTPVSYAQIYSMLGKNKKWVEKTIQECLDVANSYQIPVTVGLEDATRANMAFMYRIVRIAQDMGVDTVRLADTVGILFPKRAMEMVKEMKQNTKIQIEVHEHNDFGMAVANSLVMVNAGADLVDTTLCGIGERAGNCDMSEFIHVASRRFNLGIQSNAITKAEELLKGRYDK